MPDDAPHFDDRGRLIAPQYGDVYFSAEDGLAETEHVFLQGNGLAQRFAELQPGQGFAIGETGFGTGLNFLAAWRCFEQHAPAEAQLHFVSVEGFPLDVGSVRRALSPWPQFSGHAEAMLTQWGGFCPGVHRLRFAGGRVRLTLLIGEAAEALAGLQSTADAWFLDGFAPSRNPAMWSEAVFAHLARCSGPGTTLATYTAAGFVRRGLQAAGFDVEKQPGFGTKRDMTVGRYIDSSGGRGSCRADEQKGVAARQEPRPPRQTRSAIVIGGSLAGSFVARSLAERGIAVTVIEQQPSVSSSQFPPSLIPRTAVLQPKINDQADHAGRFLREGYAYAYRLMNGNPGLSEACGWSACGTFQAAHDERSTRRLARFVEQFGHTGLCRWVEAAQTGDEIGLPLPCGGVLIEDAGVLNPAGLCAWLLDHPRIELVSNAVALGLERVAGRWTVRRSGMADHQADIVVVANGIDGPGLLKPWADLDLRPVRGQVTLLPSGAGDGDGDAAGQARRLTALRRALFFGGYLLPLKGGTQTLGASFIPGDTGTEWRDAEHSDVCDKLARILPGEAEQLHALEDPAGWVGLRTTPPTHRCYAQAITDGLYVSLGHGSHGIASAARAAEHLADLITRGVVTA